MPNQKIFAFLQLFVQWHVSRLKLEDKEVALIRKLSLEEFQISVKRRLTWKRVAVADALIHTMIGFIIVAIVLCAVPEVINDATRLTVFLGVIFSHLALGICALIALYRNQFTTLKFVIGGLILLQMSILGMTSSHRALCFQDNSIPCNNTSFLASHVILPNFLHSFVFAGILIIFLVQAANSEQVLRDDFDSVEGKLKTQKTYQFAHITVIVEEVV